MIYSIKLFHKLIKLFIDIVVSRLFKNQKSVPVIASEVNVFNVLTAKRDTLQLLPIVIYCNSVLEQVVEINTGMPWSGRQTHHDMRRLTNPDHDAPAEWSG